MNKNCSDLITILKHAINQTSLDENFTCSINEVLDIAKRHGVFNTAFPLVLKLTNLTEEQFDKYESIYNSNVAQQLNQDYYFLKLSKAFEQAQIPYLHLKGKQVRNVYPQPEMRISSDIDVLFQKSYEHEIINVFKNLGFPTYSQSADDIIFSKPPFITCEMHSKLECFNNPDYYDEVWEKTFVIGSYKHKFSNEDFYIYFILHYLKHFCLSGMGIRSVIDVYLLNKKLSLNRDYINDELKKLKAFHFEQAIIKLSEFWFNDGEETNDLSNLSDYILSSGIYGSIKNRVANELPTKKNKFAYFMSRVFPNLKFMRNMYPVLIKAPILLPFCWIARIFNRFIHKNKLIKQSITAITGTQNENIEKQRKLFEQLNIK